MTTATKSANGRASVIEIPEISIGEALIEIEGTSPLIMHAWSEKAKGEIRDKQQAKPAAKKAPKDPEAEYEAAFHRLADGRPGFPAVAFKAALVGAARHVDGLAMTFLRGALHIDGDLVEILGEPRMREDMVRVGGKGPGTGVADIRYRPEFPEWTTVLPISFNRNSIQLAQVVHLLNVAGFAVGVGEWRPDKGGSNGRFRVKSVRELA